MAKRPDKLALAFAALADPTRRAIVEQLMAGPQPVGKLELPRKLGAPALSKHLAVLARAGLISQRWAGRFRICKLETAPLRELATWVDRHRRKFASQRAALERYLG